VDSRHILITGGTGYIGGYLSSNLIKAGYRVTSASRAVEGDENHICVDLSDENSVIKLANKLSNVDTIIHCAATAHGERPPRNYSVASFNTTITKNLLNAFANYSLHWIFMSSISVYGVVYSKSQIPIIFSPESTDSYGSGKLFDEKLFISRCKHLDILRLMPVYDSKNIHDIKKRVYLPKINIKIMINPSPVYSICNIKNVLSAVQCCMKYCSGQRLTQVGDSEPVSQKELTTLFSGKAIPIPQSFFKYTAFLLPQKIIIFRKVSLMLKKLGLGATFEVGTREIKNKKNLQKVKDILST
jgi:nucleoside-diphosphate-sugar epimerase